MALIGEMRYLQIGGNTYEIPTSELPIASSSTLGGIKVGTNLSIDSSTGVLSVTGIPTISITRNLTSGTKSATINIDGTDYDIYSETNTDTKVMQIPLNGVNASHGLLFSLSTGSTQTTIGTVYTSNKILYSDYTQCLYIYNSDRTKYGYYKFDSLYLANSTTSYSGLLKTADVTANRTYTLPDATGTIALTSDIPSIPVNISAFTNDAGYITSSDIPVTSVNGQTGAVTVTDQNVTQTAAGTTTSAEYRLLLSNSTNDTTETNGVFKAGKLTYNPFYNRLILYPGTSDSGKLRIYYRDGFYFNLEPYGYSGDSSNYNAIVAFTSGNGKDVVLRGIRVPSNDNDAANKLYVDTHSLPTGGTAGQFLVKSSSTDYDAAWVTVPSANGVSF